MYSACGNAALPALGFPIRESADHRLFSASPRLIAAVHALLRLLVPRHPPCALDILTVILIGVFSPAPQAGRATPQIPAVADRRRRVPGDTRDVGKLCSFQGPRKAPARQRTRLTAAGPPARDRSLKTQQHAADEPRLGLPDPVDVTRSRPPSTPGSAMGADRRGRRMAGARRLRRWVDQPLHVLELP